MASANPILGNQIESFRVLLGDVMVVERWGVVATVCEGVPLQSSKAVKGMTDMVLFEASRPHRADLWRMILTLCFMISRTSFHVICVFSGLS